LTICEKKTPRSGNIYQDGRSDWKYLGNMPVCDLCVCVIIVRLKCILFRADDDDDDDDDDDAMMSINAFNNKGL
jgi:hypothetical protein